MGENNCKWTDWQRINFQNIQAARYQKNKQPSQKMGGWPKQTFLQRKHADGQWTHEKMLSLSHHVCVYVCLCVSRSVGLDSLQSYGLCPTRLLCLWGSPGQEYWSGLPFPSPRHLPDPGIKPGSPALQADALEKCKSKLQWNITSHSSEWPSFKNLQKINAGEDVEKRDPSCTVDGNVNWYSH